MTEYRSAQLTDTPYRKYTDDNLPELSQSSTFEDFELDVHAVVTAITEGLQ